MRGGALGRAIQHGRHQAPGQKNRVPLLGQWPQMSSLCTVPVLLSMAVLQPLQG